MCNNYTEALKNDEIMENLKDINDTINNQKVRGYYWTDGKDSEIYNRTDFKKFQVCYTYFDQYCK